MFDRVLNMFLHRSVGLKQQYSRAHDHWQVTVCHFLNNSVTDSQIFPIISKTSLKASTKLNYDILNIKVG